MDYGYKGENQASASIGAQPLPAATLERFIERLEKTTAGIREIGHKLSHHADRLHGEAPNTASGSQVSPVRNGALGRIEDLLDNLDQAHSFVAEQAGRNCTLV